MGETMDQKVLEFTENSQKHLNETRKWAMFFSIMAIVLLGVLMMIFIFVFYLSGFQQMPNVAKPLVIIYLLVISLIYVLPIYYLMRFASNSKYAVRNHDSKALAEAMRYLKLNFRYTGILAIILLGFYATAGTILLAIGKLPWAQVIP